MGHRYGALAAFAACVSAAIVVSAASPAAASPAVASAAAGWHLTDFPDTCNQLPLELAVTGSNAAWMMAEGFPNGGQCPADGMDVSHWNGKAWTLLPATTALEGQTGYDGAIAASSATNVWVFPLVFVGSSPAYASPENWNGSAWTDFPLPFRMNVGLAVTYGRSDAWVFGPKYKGTALGLSVAAHFNGISWQPARLPGEPLAVSALAANDIWAVGPSAKTAAKKPDQQVLIAMHWDGKTWQTMSTPRIRVGKGEQVLVNGAVATSPKNLFWSYALTTTAGKELRWGGKMLHWNGRKWTEVKLPTAAALFPSAVAAQDGDGGVWVTSTGGNSSAPVTVAYHYSAAGRWTRDVLPIPAGFNSTSLNLFWIPHTRSLWAVGFAHASTNAEVGIVERYTAP